MKSTVSVNLESLNPDGVEIVSDVTDELGRLLAKAPCALDPKLKKLLLDRGVRAVLIRNPKGSSLVFDPEILEKEIDLLKKRLILLTQHDHEEEFIKMVVETVHATYHSEKSLPEHLCRR